MAKKGKKQRAPKNKANGYKMPPPIPLGEIIHDIDRKWKIGRSIGVGGFGEIYCACEYREDESESPLSDLSDYLLYPYVVKIEPEENGPLFVEMHFYNRNYDEDDIQKFMESRELSHLGMPTYLGSGSHKLGDAELRFLILERYGTDLWKIFKQAGRRFPAPTVFQLGLQMLDVLDYIHSRSYIHADIKASNILLGLKEGTENQAYLLDFGLAFRIVGDNYMPDPKSAHEGTVEYTSTDRHTGAKTMRGDLEILGYNLLQWLVGELPWENVLENPKKVHKMKTDFMKNVRATIKTNFPNVPDNLIKFFEYMKTLEPGAVPDYTICRQIFESYLTSVGKTRTSPLEFPTNLAIQPSTSNDLRNGDSTITTEHPEIDNNNKLDDSQDDTNKKRKSTEELDTPKAKISKNQKQIVTKKKESKANKDKNPESDKKSLSNSGSVSGMSDTCQEQEVTNKKPKRKIDKIPEVIPLSEEQSEDNQEQEVIMKKRNKKKTKRNVKIASKAVNENRKMKKSKKRKSLKRTPAESDSSSDSESEVRNLPKKKSKRNKIESSISTMKKPLVKTSGTEGLRSANKKERVCYRNM